jgi:hypothetical protein
VDTWAREETDEDYLEKTLVPLLFHPSSGVGSGA